MSETAPGIVILDDRAKLVAHTPARHSVFFGFHDISPFSPDDQQLVCLRIPQGAGDMASTSATAEICLWEPQQDAFTPIAETDCWNFQQAARQQWLEDGSGRIAFNTRDEKGAPAARIITQAGVARRAIDGGLYALARDGTWALSPDFTALSHCWPAYGYRSLTALPHTAEASKTGLWRIDLATGTRRLLLSLADVATGWSELEGHFLTHPSISPDGRTIVFLHRFFARDGGSYTRLLACDAQGQGLRVLADEKVSHFDWLDNDSLIVWARFAGGGLATLRRRGVLNNPFVRPLLAVVRRLGGRWKKQALAEAYYRIPLSPDQPREKLGWPDLDVDGHPMVARSHGWLVTDTYPDRNGDMTLLVWNRHTGERVDIARIADGTLSTDSDAKCDLHPRWDRAENRIAVDFCREGLRGIAIFDVAAIVRQKAC